MALNQQVFRKDKSKLLKLSTLCSVYRFRNSITTNNRVQKRESSKGVTVLTVQRKISQRHR